MDEKTGGAKRRRAFADFKENQYDDSFSLNQNEKISASTKRVIKIILLVIMTVVFIILGFCITDSLIKISEQPYHDKNTYTAAYVNTTTTTTQSTEESTTQPSSDIYSYSQPVGYY